MKCFRNLFIAAMVMTLAVSSFAAAEDNFSITMSSREILYHPASQTAISLTKVILQNPDSSYTITSDGAQVDFKTNLLRASGDVYLTFSKRTDSALPEWGNLNADFTSKTLHGKDLLVDLERGEAMLVPQNGNPVYIDLNFSRFIPPVKGLLELPRYEKMPENDIVVCFGMSYSTTGKFTLSDATYFAPDGSQYYTARVVADGPSLSAHNLNLKYFSGAKKRASHGTPPYKTDYVSETNGKAVWWLNNEPRHSTYLNVTGDYSEKRGFQQMTPTLVHHVSLNNVASDVSVSYDELQRSGVVSATTYTGSRNRYTGYYQYGKENYSDEFDSAEYYDKSNTLGLSATIWEKDFRVGLSYLASDGESSDNLLDGSWSRGLTRAHKSLSLSIDMDPMYIPHLPYSFSMFAYAARSRDDSTLLTITSPTTYSLFDNEDRQSSVAFLPTLSAGPIKVFGNSFITQTVEYFAYRSSVDSSLSSSFAPASYDSSNLTHYSLNTDTKLVVPSYNNINFELDHTYAKYSGIEEARGSAGASYTYNGKDYLFVGEAFDFNNSRWDELLTDLSIRRDNLRIYYSGRFNLLTNDYNSQVIGLVADLNDYTLAVSYEDEDADFRAAMYMNYNFGGTFMNLFHKQKEAAMVK